MITLAVDFGGRRIKLGIVEAGRVSSQRTLPAEADRMLAGRLDAVEHALRELCSERRIRLDQCAGLGIAYPSIIDRRGARILDHFGKFGDASALDLRGWAQERLGLPLAMENDARMALIGEWRYGVGRECSNLVMMMLGTGIGTSAIIEGAVLQGAHSQAGILGGHLTLRYGGRPCVCGNVGCAEAEASTSVLDELAKRDPDFGQSDLGRDAGLDYAGIFRRASQGDALARRLVTHSLEVWSSLAVSLIHAYDPDLLILGGGVMGSADVILPAVRDHVARHAHTPWGQVRIAASELGDQAALLGCEWLVAEELQSRDS
jgi:glucokinase